MKSDPVHHRGGIIISTGFDETLATIVGAQDTDYGLLGWYCSRISDGDLVLHLGRLARPTAHRLDLPGQSRIWSAGYQG